MRIWTLHPKYLDPQGPVALWREALLAQKVLLGLTRGYRSHPRRHPDAGRASTVHHRGRRSALLGTDPLTTATIIETRAHGTCAVTAPRT